MLAYNINKLLTQFLFVYVLAIHFRPSTALPLAKESFTIQTKLNVFNKVDNSRVEHTAEVSEAYSVDQKRAKLSFFNPTNPEIDQQYKDFWFEPGQLVTFTPGTGDCYISDTPETITNALKYDLFNFEIDDIPEYIVGPARLLFFIEEHQKELKLLELSKTYLVRNIPCLLYGFTYTDKKSEQIKVQVFYSGTSLNDGKDQIPVRVNIISDPANVVIEYSKVQVMKMDFFSKAFSETSDNELLDDFLITTSCDYVLQPVKLFSQPDKYNKFSFEVEVTSGTETDYNSGLEQLSRFSSIYDSKLGLMRVKRDKTSQSPTNLYKTLDFKNGYSYKSEEKDGDMVMSNCLIYKTEKNIDVSMGQTLLGEQDFAYLGKAKYRGINTRVYKSKNAQLPLWVENPLEYTTYEEEVRVHSGSQKPDGSISVINIVLHVSDQEVPVPVLMTINQEGFIQRIDFYNFVWNIHHSSRELFSLADMCSEEGREIQVEMVLGTDDKRMSELSIPNPHFESSLMENLQNFFSLPVVMVHSVELRKINTAVFVSFIVADHQEKISDLLFLGHGKSLDYNRMQNQKIYKKVRTFNMCVQIASRIADEVSFAWNQDLHSCIVEEGYKSKPYEIYNFKISKSLEPTDYEIYSIKQRQAMGMTDASKSWRVQSSSIKSRLLDHTLNLQTESFSESAVDFHVERVIIAPINELSDENDRTIVGFSLMKDEQSWQVKSRNTKEQVGVQTQTMAGAMSLYQCRAKCLEDRQCQSYSVCQHSMELECMNSKRNFSDINIIKQLNDLRDDTNTKKDTFEVDIGGGEKVNLLKRSHCNIYNKVYMDFYKKRTRISSVIFPGQLLDVYTYEDCARRCFEVNADVLAEDSKLKLRISTIYLSYLPQQDINELHQLLAERRSIRKKICNGFMFAPESRVTAYLGSGNDNVNIFLSNPNSPPPQQPEGYCRLDQVALQSIEGPAHQFLKVVMNHYVYRFDHLYESFSGVHLKPTPLSDEQQRTYLYHAGNQDRNVPNNPLAPVRDLLDAGYNFQRVMPVPDEVSCATMCITGRLGPWPFCQSFDTEVDEYSGNMVCYLNSITLSNLMDSENGNLVEEVKTKGKSWIHYEPRDELALLESIEGTELRVLEQEELRVMNSQLKVDPFSSFLIIILVVIGSGYIGYRAGQVVLRMTDQHISNVPLINVDFINQVTSQGLIR